MNPINVTSITFYPRKDAKNHHTDEYDLINVTETPTPIYRRGFNFEFDVNFNRPFNEQLDVVRISFSFGPNANVTKGTRVILPVLHLQKEIPKMNRWNLAFKGKTNNTVHLQVHVPASAQVGIWVCTIQTNISGSRDKRSDFKCDDEIYIIFNPWCREDPVYMPKTSDLNEYIMNETGKVWVGSFNKPESKKWIFGQFDEIVLPAAVFLLEKSDLPHSDRGSPILVARAISALINANDDDGLLVGKWDGDYSEGTSPFDWTGSTAIMDQYLSHGGQPVKYGQCWVFSAATVSICRTLGIPCRSVTNYISAHDTNRSLTVDKFFDIFGELIENGPQGDCNDTCWNFHVWNDVWMNRPDLPKGYGGWQIIDGTPQELSGSIYCCGPASVEAVKKGEVGFLYDTPFVFSEVNADICHYQEDEESEWGFSRLSINRYHVGRKILTKHPDLNDDVGDSDMFDVTSVYKYPEGSEAEKLAIANAIKGVTKAQEHYSVPPKTIEDVFFDLIDIDTVPFGQDFYVEVHIKNNSQQSRSITTNLSATSVYYTGATAERLKAARGSFVVNPGKTEIIKLKVKLAEYMYKLVDHNLIKIYAIANVNETKQSWCEEDDFVLTKPELSIKVDKNVHIGQETTAVFSFSNPIHIPLTNCKYTVEGHGLIRPKTVYFRDVNSNETVTFKESFVPTLPKQRTLVCTFSSKQVEGIQDKADIEEPKEADILIIRQIDPCLKFNGDAHHTSKYELMNRPIDPELVVRRGQPFYLELTLSRPYNHEKDAISFIFTVTDEDNPTFGQNTLVAVPLLKHFNRHDPWNVTLDSTDGNNNIKVHITPAPDCIVAKWHMEVDTKIIDGDAYSYSWETGIYILFNPWCKTDQVFLKDEEWRNESVLEDVGLIYRGTFNRIRPCIWKYQQFEKHVLECSLYLVKHIGKIRGNFRADPVLVSRALSAAVNSVDDNGAVMGNWSEDFSGGTPPTKWIGSMEILQKYYKKKKPVKYGQCWVFSGVLTTICRALGIPCRTITNYKSAHDTQNSLTVDYFMDENGKILDELNSDSIWNFHVWNEVWMQRPDLGRTYIGWQAIDATPQEQSDDMYRVGPSSAIAVKLGEVKRPYDTGFLFAEVNADKVYWRYTGPNHPLKLLGKDIHSIGKLIITKTPGKWEFDDITTTYKHPEQATEERTTMFKALKQSENLFARYYLNDDFNDITFNLEIRDDSKIGQPFSAYFVMTNINKVKDYTVVVTLRIDAIAYTGKVGENIKQDRFKVQVKADKSLELKTSASYHEYSKKLMDQASFNVSCLAAVEDTEFEYYTQDEFRVRKPDIKIILLGQPKQNQEIPVDVYLENPLPVPLKKCEFTIDAPGLSKKLSLKVKNSVAPGQKALVKFRFAPPNAGSQTIAAKFVSSELEDVDGFLNFIVEPSKIENGQS